MKNLFLFPLVFGFSCSLFAGLQDGKYTGTLQGKTMGKGEFKFTETREIKNNNMTVQLTFKEGEKDVTKSYSLKLDFTADDFFKVESPDVVKGGGYCFKSICHYGGEGKDGYFDVTMAQSKLGLYLNGSFYNKDKKEYHAFTGVLKPVRTRGGK